MPNRPFLLKVISAILIVSALGFLFLLDARNSSRGAGTYYPGVDAEKDADHIYVVTGAALDLHPLRLRRVDTVTVQVNVEFEDGSRPRWSNLLFHNLSFPQQAVISDEAPGIENGKG